MKPRALVLDLFGTIVPKWSSRSSSEAKEKMAQRIGVSKEELSESWRRTWWDRELGRVSLEESLRDAAERLPVASVSESDVRYMLRVWTELMDERVSPRDGEVAQLLGWCRTKELRVGLVSNAGPAVPPAFKRSGLASLFDAAVFSCEVGVAKPDPRIYESVCARLSVGPQECIYVGDGGDDELQGALQVGMAAILLRVDDEIREEGAPPGALRWAGPAIHELAELRRYVDQGYPVEQGRTGQVPP